MKQTFARYGIPSDDIEATRERVEKLFDEELGGVSSDIWGLYYMSLGSKETDVVSIYSNYSPDHGEGFWNEPDHKEFPLLLGISRSPNFDEMHKLVMSDPSLGAVLTYRRDSDKPTRASSHSQQEEG